MAVAVGLASAASAAPGGHSAAVAAVRAPAVRAAVVPAAPFFDAFRSEPAPP
ncbi:hypothetical protein [Nostoc sp. 'Lobaria pulmonaria (5183) cyanobiont']|uniref:hypothetical protein n=1 Tax=Nostoc sp. 'Lobaria pulmonaria (5183) cyanobiont' TaxID=1618022 RepID=UPI00131A41BD|nr:hypothetical protein [Nostoc sp. 'Lobaria pulmonaria (5183) cyanobiont']